MGKVFVPPGAQAPPQGSAMQMVPVQHRGKYPVSNALAFALPDGQGGMNLLILGGMSQLLHVAAMLSAGDTSDRTPEDFADRAIARAKALIAAAEAVEPKPPPLPGE